MFKAPKGISPIVEAINKAEQNTTGEIRVHLSKKWLERDPYRRATKLFRHFEMFKTANRNGVLLYVNFRRRKFAILGDEGFHQKVGQKFWDEAALDLKRNFASTHPENAIAMTVLKIGEQLSKHFPLAPGAQHTNQVPNEFTQDRS